MLCPGIDVPRSLTNGVLILFAIVVATTPVVLMRWALSAHATRQAQASLQNIASRMGARVDAVLSEAADLLAAVAPGVRGGCRPETRELLSTTVFEASYVKNLLVLDPDGQAVCGSGEIPASRMTDLKFRPARQKNLAVAASTAGDGARVVLHMSWQEGETMILATLAPDAHRLDIIPTEWRNAAIADIAFDDGTTVATIPNEAPSAATTSRSSRQVLSQSTASERFPLKVTVSVPFDAVWAVNRSLTTFVDIGGGLMGAVFFALVVHAARRPVSVEDALARGIRRDEFVPFYQPVFNIQRGELIGCEVLIRWVKRDGTIVPPGAFIQQAEESGLAVEMTRQLMRKARDEVGEIYASRPHLKLAFNLFADHFSDFSTVEDVRDIFGNGGVRYSQLVFEVTERYPLPNLNRAKVAISGLQELGCRVALDDAGTGHGGLAYLQKLGMDQIKIDKLFVDTITATSVGSPIVSSLIELGHSMGMEIVAEGVETADQLQYLKARGVDCAQGYLFAKPLAGRSYIKLIEAMVPVVEAEAKRLPLGPQLAAA